MNIDLAAIVVRDYDPAIAYFVDVLGQLRSEVYGRVVVFRDIAGNSWDLLGT